MAEKAHRSGILFRPHFKTHQSIVIGRWFREAGVTRITVSSLTAARYFASDGWDDITIAFPVNLREIDLINHLASEIRIGLLVEHTEVVEALEMQLKYPVDIYMKIDTGLRRTGLNLDDMPLIRALAERLRQSPLLNFRGLLTHAGQSYQASEVDNILQINDLSVKVLKTVRDQLGDQYRDLLLSCGDTPTCSLVDSFDNIDEIRPGNFVFYDLMQMVAGVCRHSQVAGIVVCPVVALHSSRNQAVLYGGAIHFSKDSIILDGRRVFGQMVEMDEQGWNDPIPGAYLVSLSQEHGILEAPEQIIKELNPGKIAGIIPVHACLTANLMHGYQFLDGSIADYFSGI